METQRSREYWDRFWEADDGGVLWKHHAAASLVDREPIVDIGCGGGVMLELLRSMGKKKTVGCDISWTSARSVAKRRLTTVCCDAEGLLPFADGSFGTATLVDVLEHFFDPARVLAESCRVAEEVVVVVPNFNSAAARYQVLFGRAPENNTPRKRHVYWFNYATLNNLLVSMNLRVMRRLHQPFMSGGGFVSAPFALLSRVRPELFSLAFAIKVRAEDGES